MKAYIILISFILLFNPVGITQNCDNVNNTDPETTISDYDWQRSVFDRIFIEDEGMTIEIFPQSPFFFNASNQNINHLSTAISKDFLEEDGWVLLHTNFETFIEDDPDNQTRGVSVPSFALYNRYESIVRTFFYISSNLNVEEGYNKARITSQFDVSPGGIDEDFESALFAPVNTPLKSLTAFEKELEMHTPNFYENGGDYWLHADFPVYYDPCTCEYPSAVIIKPFLLDIQQIELDMVGGGSIFPKSVISNGNMQNNPFQSILSNLEAGEKQGKKISKTFGGFISNVEAIGNLFTFRTVQSSGTGTIEEKEKKAEANLKKSFKLPKWLKAVPKIGEYFTVLEYLVGGGKKKAKAKPTSYEANLKFNIEGTAESSDEFQNLFFYTPGSAWHTVADQNPNYVPVYNNILGTFSLLNTPKIGYRSYGNNSGNYYQVMNELEYAINPFSGLSETPVDIKAALMFEGCHKSDIYLQGVPPFSGSDFFVTENVETGDVILQTPFLPLSCLAEYVADINWLTAGNTCVPRVSLKMAVAMQRDEDDYFFDADAEDVIFTANYAVNLVEDNSIVDSEIGKYQINLTIQDDVTHSQDETTYAWSTIEINADINANGNMVEYVAGAEIIVEEGVNGGDLIGDVDLVIGTPIQCTTSDTPQSPAQIASFCQNSDKYNPAVSLLPEEELPQRRNLANNEAFEFELSVNPNPFTDQLFLNYSSNESKPIKLMFLNTLGQEIKSMDYELTEGEEIQETINTTDLPKGFYLLKVNYGNNGSQTFKITKG